MKCIFVSLFGVLQLSAAATPADPPQAGLVQWLRERTHDNRARGSATPTRSSSLAAEIVFRASPG